MSAVAYIVLEISTLILFGLAIWHAARRGLPAVAELLTASLYGVVLEWGNILIFKTYEYSPDFWFAVGPVPIVIGLCWGMIIYGAMAYSDQLGLVVWAAPLADALLAILLDFAFDAVAIRLRLWTWTIPMNAGYFGVPANNFYSWLLVAIAFSAYTRWVRSRRTAGWHRPALQLGAPLAAFVGLFAGIKAYGWLEILVYGRNVPVGGSLLFFGLTVIALALAVALAIWRAGVRIQHGIDLIPTLVRWAIHGYFLAWALLLALVPALRLPGMDMPPILVGIAAALLVVEALLLAPVVRLDRSLRRQLSIRPVELPRGRQVSA